MNNKNVYLIAVVIIIFHCWLGETPALKDVFSLIRIPILTIIVLLFGVEMIQLRYDASKLFIHIAVITLALYSSLQISNMWMLYSALIILFSERHKEEEIIKTILITMGALFLFNIVSFTYYYFYSPQSLLIVADTNRIRYALEFASPNEAARFWVYLTFLWYFLRDKIGYYEWMIIFFITGIIYYLTDSEALFYILFLPLITLLYKSIYFKKIISNFSRYSFALLAVLTWYLITHMSALIYLIDAWLFTGRLRLSELALQQYGYTLLGQKIETFVHIGGARNYSFLVVDNAYAYFLISYGIVFLAIVSFLFIAARVERKDYRVGAMFLLYAAFGLAENNIIEPSAVFPVILAYKRNPFVIKHYVSTLLPNSSSISKQTHKNNLK